MDASNDFGSFEHWPHSDQFLLCGDIDAMRYPACLAVCDHRRLFSCADAGRAAHPDARTMRKAESDYLFLPDRRYRIAGLWAAAQTVGLDSDDGFSAASS